MGAMSYEKYTIWGTNDATFYVNEIMSIKGLWYF
jgi:hypothetical protein